MEIYNDKITPQYVLDTLKKDGIIVNTQEAKQLLEFFNLLADILIDDFLGV
ncbi:hypothetical protein [Pedobacter sp. V48]|uniref:hypothetical protein n=1 Tax=Pedobacter sp. V48 TaxID=509635 RepID=UPI0004AE17E8|nr:hypothetical protein [Pedobacter sp. V48]